MKAPILILALPLLLTACANNPAASRSPGLYTLPIGTILQLNEPLVIPARKARAGIQDGKPAISDEIDKWHPYCEFLVNTITDRNRKLPAGNYQVTRIQRDQVPYGELSPNGGKMLAFAGQGIIHIGSDGSPDQNWLYKTNLRLKSTAYPDVRQLECGSVFSGYEARHMTMEEFKQAVGDMITIRLPGKD